MKAALESQSIHGAVSLRRWTGLPGRQPGARIIITDRSREIEKPAQKMTLRPSSTLTNDVFRHNYPLSISINDSLSRSRLASSKPSSCRYEHSDS